MYSFFHYRVIDSLKPAKNDNLILNYKSYIVNLKTQIPIGTKIVLSEKINFDNYVRLFENMIF